MEWLEKINSNSGVLTLIFSGVVTVATVVTAWLNARLVAETRKMRAAQTEPCLQLTYRSRDESISLLDVMVKNIGLGPAYDISFSIRAENRNDLPNDLEESLGKLACFSQGLVYLGPNQEFSSFWTSLYENHASKLDSRILVTCRFRSVTGEWYETPCVLDLSELKGVSRIGQPPLLSIAKHLESIKNDLGHLTNGSKRIKVDSFSKAGRDTEQAEWDQERAAYAEKRKDLENAGSQV